MIIVAEKDKEQIEEELDIAEVGQIVKFKGMKGKVEKINDNSVIVDITINEDFDENEMFEKTVVNHKNYEIIE
ncbi:DUF2187 domain-containing protein [Abyssicoccus albus]|nr:DUF2187 domain-containing protein [Abyssicoccus albus]